MKIRDFLLETSRRLRAVEIDTTTLDAELLLAFFAKKSREFLRAHDELELGEIMNASQLKLLESSVKSRETHTPLAYIFREKEFYGRDFYVDENVLVPRPESEAFIDILRDIFAKTRIKQPKILDVGTGSGILAITTKLEFPATKITAVDISDEALAVAKKNADSLAATIDFRKSNLLDEFDNQEIFDIIIANLPYVSRKWNVTEASPELKSEPELALFAEDNGNALNKKLIQQADSHLTKQAFLVLEMDPTQLDEISNFAKKYGFREISRKPYQLILQKA